MNIKLILFLIAAFSSFADPNSNLTPERKAFVREYFKHIKDNPNLRLISGDVYDFTLVISWDVNLTHTPATLLSGNVDQIAGGGAYMHDRGERIFLTNYPSLKTLVDGDRVQCVAIPIGPHAYKSVLGARTTVKAFDHGTPFKPKETPEFVYRITTEGIVKLTREMAE